MENYVEWLKNLLDKEFNEDSIIIDKKRFIDLIAKEKSLMEILNTKLFNLWKIRRNIRKKYVIK